MTLLLNNMKTRIGARTVGVILGFIICFGAGTGRAQPFGAAQGGQQGAGIEVLQLRPNFYLIASAVSNVGVQIGADGVVLVNAGPPQASGEILAAIQRLTKEPIRYIINTSADADLVGGNRTFSKAGLRLGALPVRPGAAPGPDDAAFIVAHENVVRRMSTPSATSGTGTAPPFPSESWPDQPFHENRKYMSMNGEGIEIVLQPAAHTDGDTVVFFRKSDVVVAGHILDATRFPMIDLARGGSIQGEINALNRLIELAIPAGPFVGLPTDAIANQTAVLPGGTEIIPGRGRVYRQIDVVDYRDAVVIIRDTIQYMIGRGMTLEQIKAAAPAKAWEPRFGAASGPWTTNDFVEAVYKSLLNEKQQPPVRR